MKNSSELYEVNQPMNGNRLTLYLLEVHSGYSAQTVVSTFLQKELLNRNFQILHSALELSGLCQGEYQGTLIIDFFSRLINNRFVG